jgi:hypothetical protein
MAPTAAAPVRWRWAALAGACLVALLAVPIGRGDGGGLASQAAGRQAGAGGAAAPPGRVRVAGALVAGGAGGMGTAQAGPFSEAVRAPDGSCTGWRGRGAGDWTAGLERDAGFALLDPRSGAVLGAGRLTAGRWVDVDPSPAVEQWQCSFGFDVEAGTGLPWYEIQVGDLPVWPVVPDPSVPGRFAGSVNLLVPRADFPGCPGGAAGAAGGGAAGAAVVGAFWSDGVLAVCADGLRVSGIRRACRPTGVGSDHVIAVVDPKDPARIYQDRSGRRPGATPARGGAVALLVAGGVPCA